MAFPISWFRRWNKELTRAEFSDYLLESVRNSALNSHYPDRSRFKSIQTKSKDTHAHYRWLEISLFRLRTGHTNTRDHFHLLSRKDSDEILCRHCEKQNESAEHILLKCTRYYPENWIRRSDLLEQAQREGLGSSFGEIISSKSKKLEVRLCRLLRDLKDFGVAI